ncbi:MAG TPA: hypothetical protein PKW80_03765 [Bacteroidales bacterium]|nr:hypothetical protein [Bacteroidales bacterium]
MLLYLACGILTIWYYDGTGDAGDSMLHYLFARYALQHPGNFFDHWAKPVFVLLSSPFAQFGFNGMKLFNLVVTATALYITYLSCNLLKIKNAEVVALLMIFAPYAYAQTFSGLTEPLFALFLITGIYLVLKQKPLSAAIVISFMPFVRSEGLMILVIFALYFVVRKKWKCLLFLLCGHVLYSIAGFFIHHDFLWVFSKIPYTRLSSAYGSGNALHFVTQLMYVAGVPVYILFWLGIVSYISLWIRKKEKMISENTLLVMGCAVTFIFAHSLFWALGIFNSMGLKRVLIGILPLIAIISLQGFNFITEQKSIHRNLKSVIQLLIVIFICLFPFTKNPAALNFKKDLSLDESQKCAREVTKFVTSNFRTIGKLYYSYPYFSETFGIDYFDKTKHLELKTGNLDELCRGDLIIWDDWFALHTSGTTTSSIEQIPGIGKIVEFSVDGRVNVFILYRYD